MVEIGVFESSVRALSALATNWKVLKQLRLKVTRVPQWMFTGYFCLRIAVKLCLENNLCKALYEIYSREIFDGLLKTEAVDFV